jgi:hypothetical protein
MAIVVKWEKMGEEFSYNVLYARNPLGPWTVYNTTRLTDAIIDKLRNISGLYDSVSYNEYYLEGLEDNTNYSVKVSCFDRYDSWWYSYSSYNSVEGGASTPNESVSPDGGNNLNLKFNVSIG